MRSQAVNIKMIDVLWDRYFQDSFKAKQETNQGAGVRTKVSSNGKRPNNWTVFLCCNDNKSELFPSVPSTKVISGATHDKNCCCYRQQNGCFKL